MKLLPEKLRKDILSETGSPRWKLALKLALILLLLAGALTLFFVNRSLAAENRRMAKLIRSEDNLDRQYRGLEKSEALFYKKILRLNRTADPERIKSNYIDVLLNLVKEFDLTVDSYRSEVEAEGNFTIFKYHVTLLGDFIGVLRFFHQLKERYPFIYVLDYIIKLHGDKRVRMDLKMEILGEASPPGMSKK